jgi:hypothetical protein
MWPLKTPLARLRRGAMPRFMANPLQGLGATADGAKQAQDAIEQGREMAQRRSGNATILMAVAPTTRILPII